MTIASAELSELTMEVDIQASAEAVWRALTSDIGNWWPKEFYAGGAEGKRRFTLEGKPGGRMLETWEEGGGVMWGHVVGVEPHKRLQVVGFSFPNWGGPSQWFGTWELSPAGNGTRLRFTENAIGRVSDAYVADKDKGWTFLWQYLKAHLEDKPLPVWQA